MGPAQESSQSGIIAYDVKEELREWTGFVRKAMELMSTTRCIGPDAPYLLHDSALTAVSWRKGMSVLP
jgi:hypothetical protein